MFKQELLVPLLKLWIISIMLYVGIGLAQSLSLSTTTIKPQYIAGQRCLLLRATTSYNNKLQKQAPPLVICIGMAQTVELWEHHLIPLSQSLLQKEQQTPRDILLYEAAGLGPVPPDPLILSNVTLPRQAELLIKTVKEAFLDQDQDFGAELSFKIDLVGYSLGGRIAMAVACIQPNLIRKLHLTGIGLSRSDYGWLQLMVWKDHLQQTNQPNLRAFAWSAILSTYRPAFLRQQIAKLPLWVESVSSSHTQEGLLAIMEQTHDEGESAWSVRSMARKMVDNKQGMQGCLIVGEDDQMAPVDQVMELAKCLQWDDKSPQIIKNCGHAVPMENSRLWRQSVVNFLSNTAI